MSVSNPLVFLLGELERFLFVLDTDLWGNKVLRSRKSCMNIIADMKINV